MRASVAELVESAFGIGVAGGPERFKKSDWFAVGLTEAECPRCRILMQGYRMPYTTKSGVIYHYWALACLKCKLLFEPANIDKVSRQLLSKSSEHRPEPIGKRKDNRSIESMGDRSDSWYGRTTAHDIVETKAKEFLPLPINSEWRCFVEASS